MMQVYYMRVSWVSGIALFAAFLLTFWPSRPRMTFAAALWALGILSVTSLSAYDMFVRGGIAYAFGAARGFPLLSWVIPLVFIILALVESIYLFAWIPQERALRVGRILFLFIVPVLVLLTFLPHWRQGFSRFPLGIEWLGYPLLWFRIRENVDPRPGKPVREQTKT